MSTEPTQTRAQQRDRERAERAEWDRLIARLRVLWPHYDCFCGTLDDLRRTVADLERKAGSARAARTAAPKSSPHHRADSGLAARAAIARAAHHLGHEANEDQLRRQQLVGWHAVDRACEHGADDAG